MERHRKKVPRFPFQASGIRVNNEPIRGPTMCPSVGPHKGQHIPPLSPNPIRFYGLSIDQSADRSIGRPTSLLSTEPIDHKSGIGVRRPFPLPQHQFVFGFGRRLACLKAANMIERLSVQAEGG